MKLFLECLPDETVELALGVPRRTVVHSHSKGRVAKGLEAHSGVVGMVDEDYGQNEPASLRKFKGASAAHDLLSKTDPVTKNRLVVICPNLEAWLIKTAKVANVDMAQFHLPARPGELHAEINFRLPNLQRLIAKLLELSSPRVLHLKELLAVRPRKHLDDVTA